MTGSAISIPPLDWVGVLMDNPFPWLLTLDEAGLHVKKRMANLYEIDNLIDT
jgi:hypothetical protein